MAERRHGSVEYGDILDVNEPHVRLGRLVIDFDKNEFWQRPDNGRATRRSASEVGYLIAHNLIVFDQPGSEKRLVDYLRRLEQVRTNALQSEIDKIRNQRQISDLQKNTKLVKKVKRKARFAKFFWFVGCSAFVALAFVATMPTSAAPAAAPSIAGVGEDYGVVSDEITDATYIEALGNGSSLYGVVTDKDIVEVGSSSSNESTIKENALYNPKTSDQPIHMRPLYYDRSSFYQTALKVNDMSGGSMGVYLQNPNGYSLGVPANELVLTGGPGLETLILCSPERFSDTSAADTADDIEDEQADAADDSDRNAGSKDDEQVAAEMPEGWNGFNSCDIDGNKVVASYWYTPGNTNRQADLRRRVAVFDVSEVMSSGADAISSMEAVQLNYQDDDSQYYDPVISESPSSNGALYWIGYIKEDSDGDTGFFIRKNELNEDILMEAYDNTLSTEDLTGNNNPITNYTLYGDKLFYEQSGYIWVLDLSKIEIQIDGNNRTISRENPVAICYANEIEPSVTRDEEFMASVNRTSPVPVSHYKVMTLTTASGVEYGIAFIEAESGNLVYQPCVSTTTSASSINAGSGIASDSNSVQNQNEAGIQQQRENNNTNSGSAGDRIDVPSLSGMTVEEAQRTLESAGLSIRVRYEPNDKTPSGEVIRWDPDSTVTTGDTISVYVSSGADGTDIPSNVNVSGESTYGDNGSTSSEPLNTDRDTVSETLNAMEQLIDEQMAYETDDKRTDDSGIVYVDGTDDTAKNGNQVDVQTDAENSDTDAVNDAEDTADEAANVNSSNGSDGSTSRRDERTSDTGRIIVKNAKDNNVDIVSYTVRGEQFIWVEQDNESGDRRIMISPVYYKNTTVQTESSEIDSNANAEEVSEEDASNENENEERGIGSDSQTEATNSNGNANTNIAPDENENVNESDNKNGSGSENGNAGDGEQTNKPGDDGGSNSNGNENGNDDDTNENDSGAPTVFGDV